MNEPDDTATGVCGTRLTLEDVTQGITEGPIVVPTEKTWLLTADPLFTTTIAAPLVGDLYADTSSPVVLITPTTLHPGRTNLEKFPKV